MNRYGRRKILILIILIVTVFLVSTCKDLFKLGMGDEVDLEPPAGSLTSPASGSFISGNIVFEGSVSDDQSVKNVEISFDRGKTWTAVEFDQSSWSYGYTTTGVSDGRLAVMIRATDAQDKVTTSEEYLFSVDNTPPVVMVTSPRSFDLLSFNTSVTMTVAATDVYQIENFRVAVQAATIPGTFDTATDDPDTLDWGSLPGYPKQINQSASPLSFEFNSLPFTIDLGAPHRYFRFAFSAQDEAGNVSSRFFHIDEVAAVNDNQLLTVDQIADILEGTSYTNSLGTVVTSSVLNGIVRGVSSGPMLLEFDEDTNLPRAGVSFPTSETTDLPTMRSSDSLQGYFEDDDGIDTSSMRILVEKAVDYDAGTATAASWEISFGPALPDNYTLNSEIGSRRIEWNHPVTDFGQGIFRITLDAQDVSGADRPAASDYYSDFMISDGAPELEIAPPANLNFNNRIQLSGTASHSIAITSVALSIGYGPTSGPTWVFEGLEADYNPGTSSWTFDTDTVDFAALSPAGGLTNLTEGEILVRAVANGETEKNIFIYKDITAPIVSFDRPEENSQLNTDAVISGAADDANSGIYNVEVLISHPDDPQDPATSVQWIPHSTTAVLGIDGYEFGPSLASWRFTFDSTAYTDNTITFYLRGTDRAGNSSTISRNFEIFQDSDLPVISLSNLNVAGTRFDNVLSGEPRFLGSIIDDDSVDPDTFRYRVKIDELSWGSWVYPYTPGEKAVTTRLDFNIPIYEPGTVSTPLSEGSHTVQLWAEDISGLGISRTAAESGGALDIELSVDGNPPAVSLTEPVTGSVKSQDFNVAGSVSDGFGIDLVQLSFDGGASYPETLYSHVGGADPDTSYTINFPVTAGAGGLADGTYNIRVRAQDLSGSSASENTTVVIDTTAPVVTISQPVESDVVNNTVLLNGTVVEALQMDAAYYWIGTEGSAAPVYDVADPTVNGWTEFSDPRNFSENWDSYNAQDPVFAAENYTFHIVARDLAGNWSIPAPRTVTVNQESDRPVIELTNADPVGNGMPSPYGTAPVNLFGANAVLNGTAADDDGVTGTDILVSFRSYDWSAEAWSAWSAWSTVSSPFAGTRTTGNWSHDISTFGEGVHQVKIRVLDLSFSGTLLDTDTTADHPDLFKWNQTSVIEFAIDTDLPTLDITSPSTGAFISGSFTINGTASDTNRLLEWDPGSGPTDYILVLENSGADWTGAVKTDVDNATGNWQYDVTVATDGTDDGYKSWQFKAIDRMGKESVHDYNFTIDTNPPSTDITAFLPSVLVDDGSGGYDEHVNGIVRFDASAGDENGIQRVKYWILPSADTAPTEATFDTGGIEIFSPYIEDIDTTLLADTAFYTLYIGSEDSAGNRGIISREIYINQASDYPAISLTNLDDTVNDSGSASSNLLESNPKVTGTVSDDDWVDSSSLEISIDGGIFGPVDIVSSSGTEVSFEHALSGEGDGTHYIQLQVSDTDDGANARKLGLASVQTTGSAVYLAIDQSNPVVVIDPPANTYTTGAFSMTGTASDGNNVGQILVSTDGGASYSATGLSITGGAGTSSQTWSWTGDLSGKPEGPFTLKVKAIDEFVKESIADLTITVDQTGPVMSISTPASAETVNGPVNISGTATETYGISYVEIALDSDGDGLFTDPDDRDWFVVTGTFAWSHLLNSTTVADTSYTVHVRGTDQAGNVTAAPATRSFIVDQSSDRPAINLSTLSEASTATENLLPGSLQMSGTATDDDSVESTSLQIRIDSNNDGDFSDGGTENWADINGQPANDANVVTWTHTFSGLSDGQYRFEMRAGDINFSGDYTDVNKAVSAGPVAFSVDTSLPEGTITYPAQGAYLKDPGAGIITITGSASDASGIKSVEISVDGAAAVPVTGTVSWSYDYTIAADDQVSYQIIITDNYDKIYTLDRYFTVDTSAPIPVYTQPSAGETVNGSLVVRGTTTEVNLVSEVYFWIGEDGAAVPSVPADPTVSADWITNGWTNLSGTFSWSERINTTLYNDVLHDVYVYALDNAGNLSVPAILQDLDFDQTTNLPVVTVNNLADAPSVNLFGTSGIISGNIIDDDSVDASSIQISFDDGASWQNVTNQGSDGTSVNWSHDLNDAGNEQPESATAYAVKLKASDVGDVTNGVPVQTAEIPVDPAAPFVVAVDRFIPAVALSSIVYADRYGGPDITLTGASLDDASVNNNFTITGTASDATGVSEVAVSEDGGTSWVRHNDSELDSFTFAAGTWSYLVSVPANGSEDGTRTFDIRVTDTWGKTNTDSISVFIDTQEPVIEFTIPSDVTLNAVDDAPNVNGDVLVRGSVTESNTVSSLAIVGGIDTVSNPIPLANSGNNRSWSTTITASGDYANSTYATDQGSNIWRLPLEVTAFDDTGNRTIETGYLDLDPDSDKPVVSIVSPADDASVSGTFLVNGTILDDDGTDYVNLQFDFDDDGLFDDSGDTLPAALLSISNDLNGNTIADDTIDESTAVTMDAPSGAWSISLNASDFSIVNLANAGYTNSTGYIRLQMTPYDINGLSGLTQVVRIYLDTNSPVISGLDATGTVETAEPTPDSGSMQKGDITIRARFEDDKELLTSGMLISFDGGATFSPITSQPGYSISSQAPTPPYEYYVEIPVDTTTAIADGNGVLSIQLSVTDQTNKQTSKALSYNIDNDFPTIHWNEDGSGTLQDLPFIGTPPNEIYTYKGNSGTNEPDDAFKVLGAAVDSGTISGISKVIVYFVKDGFFYKPTLSGSDPEAERLGVSTVSVWDGVDSFDDIPFTEDSSYVITIDNRIEQGIFDQTPDIGDFDGYQESLKAKVGYNEWYAYFDTTELPDGPLDIYSVVYDEAGNISYTVADAQIANNPPTIPSIIVGSTTIDDSNLMAKASGDIAFTINTADFENIDVSTIKMDIVARYIASSGLGDLDTDYVPTTSYAYNDFDTKPADDATSAQFIETLISDNGTPGDASDDPLASDFYYEYLVQVNDDDGNLVTRTFYLWINNADGAAPVISLDDFSQDSVAGGGGHIEEAVNSQNDAAGFEDADLSGTVTVSGTAFDLTQVTSVTVEYSTDAGANWYDAGTATAGNGLSDRVGDDINGYNYTWTVDWDTSTLKEKILTVDTVIVAKENILLRAYGTDGTNTTPESGPGARPEMSADVVPYITGITGTGFDSGLLTNVRRSAQGRYPVAAGSEIVINGFNLPVGAADSVTVGTTTNLSGTGSVIQITVDLTGVNTSGGIIVYTNNVASLNNDNLNSLPQNKEPHLYNPNLTDDRYAVFWDVSAISGTSTITDPVMHPNPPGTGYDWIYVRSGKELYYYDPDAVLPNPAEKLLTEGLSLKGGPFTYNDSGSLLFMFNHSSEWTSWDGSFAFTGSAQFGQILSPTAYSFSTDKDEAYNWNQNTTFAKLGVGNVNFGYTTNNESDLPAILQYGTYGTPDTGYLNMDLNRFENITLQTVGDDSLTRNYVAYFDTGAGESRSIVFYAFQTSDTAVSASSAVYSNGSLAASVNAGGGIVANIDKYTNGTETNEVALAGTQKNNNNGIATPRGRQEVTVVNSEEDSAYFDLAVYETDDGGSPASPLHYGFIVYFDETNQNLKITANEGLYNADPTGSLGTWTAPVLVDSDAGANVSMVIDELGGIHIAYQDIGGYMKYAYLTYSGGGSFVIKDKVFVDGLLGAGANNSIVIRNFGTVPSPDYRPVITTYSSAFNGTKAPLRLSYPLFNPGTAGTILGGADASGAFLGNWETVALPAASPPADAESFLFIDSSNRPHIGYDAATLEEATFLGF